jgi:uncharacterized protein YkwD
MGAIRSIAAFCLTCLLACFSAACGAIRAPAESSVTQSLPSAGQPEVFAALSPTISPATTSAPLPTLSASPAPTPVPTLAPAPKATVSPASSPEPKNTGKPTTKPAAAYTASPTQAPPSGGNPSKEDRMIALVNQARADAGLPALAYSKTLRAGALKHSNDMSVNDFFDHTSTKYGSFPKRFAAAGFSSGAENIAMFGSVDKAHEALMKSEGHRKNILNPNYTRIGIGIVYNESKRVYYITQWFSQ